MKVIDYIEILNIQKQDFESDLDKSIAMLSVYCDVDIEEVESMPVKEVNLLVYRMNEFMSKEIKPSDKSIPNSKISLGNFIDLETYLLEPNDLIKVIAILFRGIKLNEWNHSVYEPVEFDIEVRAKSFENNDIEDYLGSIKQYIDFRNSILETYKSIFSDSEPQELETDGLDEHEIDELIEDEKKEKQKSVYSWENFLYWLSNENILNVENVIELPLIYALNMASMKKLYES